jgi:hypothetical protein
MASAPAGLGSAIVKASKNGSQRFWNVSKEVNYRTGVQRASSALATLPCSAFCVNGTLPNLPDLAPVPPENARLMRKWAASLKASLKVPLNVARGLLRAPIMGPIAVPSRHYFVTAR